MMLDRWDVLVRNLFSGTAPFVPTSEFSYHYPIDIITTEDKLELRLAAVGLDKNDIELEVAGDRLGISYAKPEDEDSENKTYIHRGIARRGFSYAYKVSAKFDLSKLTASLEKGELIITIPIREDAKAQKILIQ